MKILISSDFHVRMAERSKAPDSSANLPWSRVERFLVSIGGVGSNPTSDIVFARQKFCHWVTQFEFDKPFSCELPTFIRQITRPSASNQIFVCNSFWSTSTLLTVCFMDSCRCLSSTCSCFGAKSRPEIVSMESLHELTNSYHNQKARNQCDRHGNLRYLIK